MSLGSRLGIAFMGSGADVRKVDLRHDIESRLGAANKTSKPKVLRNIGPSIGYKLRDAAGQAREYQNYMGARRWQMLHKLVYLIAGLGLLHFFWMRAGKNNFAEVFVYAAIIAVLLGWRVWNYASKRRPKPSAGVRGGSGSEKALRSSTG